MLFQLKKFLYTLTFNFSLFLLLMIGIQNSSTNKKVNLLVTETISLPISFIVGISFITGSFTGGLLQVNFGKKKV
tara:strand:+ start:1774 stop:1998 length:225 start_codon:yes stop_codon:yes gene_type:complete